ncbi:MAG: PadR family transcriptional regulator [Candidatus Limnocylindrales bacterium]
MGLSGALGALLLAGPSHGYELHATLEAELGSTWMTRPAQVYLTLGRMGRDGLVTSQRIHQETRPDRQRLTLTDEGHRAAEQWLADGPPDEAVVRLAVARLVVPERLPSLTAAMIDERTAALHRLRAARADDEGGFRAEARDAEIAAVEAQLRWLDALRDHLDEIVARPRVRAPDERAAQSA